MLKNIAIVLLGVACMLSVGYMISSATNKSTYKACVEDPTKASLTTKEVVRLCGGEHL